MQKKQFLSLHGESEPVFYEAQKEMFSNSLLNNRDYSNLPLLAAKQVAPFIEDSPRTQLEQILSKGRYIEPPQIDTETQFGAHNEQQHNKTSKPQPPKKQ